MWIAISLFYLAVGLIIVLFTRAKGVIEESMEDVTTITYPVWKVATFRGIVRSAAVLFWPFFIPSWFAKQKTVWDAINVNPIFQQQRGLAEALSLLCECGEDVDELPNAEGEFGMTPSNPIPCKTMFGSTSYLGRLRTLNGTKVVYRRIGSKASDVSTYPVDEYEISHPDGDKLATLFLSPYHKRISRKAPRGFQLADELHESPLL